MPIVILLLVAPIVIGVAIHRRRKHEEERTRRWRIWTQARDWMFHPTWPQVVNRFDGGPFNKGSGRRAEHGFEGEFNGVPAIGFRYTYKTSNGENTSTHRCMVVGTRLDDARMPSLLITPRTWLTVGGVSFEHAQFNKQWTVVSSSPRFAHDFVNPRVMDLLLAPHPPFAQMWTDREHLFLQVHSETPFDQIDPYLILLTRMLGHLPDFLFTEVGCRPPALTEAGPGVSWQDQQRRIAMMHDS